MDPNQRPHSRDKEVASGTAHVGKGEQVAAGGPVGGQNSRPGSKPASGSKREGSALPVRSGGSIAGVLDIDSPVAERFDLEDEKGLALLADLIGRKVDFTGLRH